MKMTLVMFALCIWTVAWGQNIDPYNDGSKYAYGENIGWVNFKPSAGAGVTVRDGKVTGYAWQENVGWINMSPAKFGGITYDGSWNLYGYAWGENIGWINFNPRYGGVRIDSAGNFSGWAWGENIGWIHFALSTPTTYKVRACVVGLDDLANFADRWLMTGRRNPADLDGSSRVDFLDFRRLAEDWCDFCADGWSLK